MAESTRIMSGIVLPDIIFADVSTLSANTWYKEMAILGSVASDSAVQDFPLPPEPEPSPIFTLKPVEFPDLPESVGDIQILPNIDNLGDFDLTHGDIATDKGLRTAVYISLFTDAFCEEDGYTATNGWWGEEYNDIGSKLWTLKRKQVTDAVANLAKTYAEEALQWMIDDGVADKIEVDTTRTGLNSIQIDVDIYKPGQTPDVYKFDFNWNAEENR